MNFTIVKSQKESQGKLIALNVCMNAMIIIFVIKIRIKNEPTQTILIKDLFTNIPTLP